MVWLITMRQTDSQQSKRGRSTTGSLQTLYASSAQTVLVVMSEKLPQMPRKAYFIPTSCRRMEVESILPGPTPLMAVSHRPLAAQRRVAVCQTPPEKRGKQTLAATLPS